MFEQFVLPTSLITGGPGLNDQLQGLSSLELEACEALKLWRESILTFNVSHIRLQAARQRLYVAVLIRVK